MKNFTFLLIILVGQMMTARLNAQCNIPAPPVDIFTEEVPIFCEGIDYYCSQLPPQYTLMNLPGCPADQFAIHNAQLLRFVAGSTTIGLRIIPSNCNYLPEGMGMQAAIYEGHPLYEGGWPLALECGTGFGEELVLQSGNFVYGKAYYLLLDGWAGSVCEYEIYTEIGTTLAPELLQGPPESVNGPSEVCNGQLTVFSTQYPGTCTFDWSINGGEIVSEYAGEITVEIMDASNFSICVAANNGCYETAESCFDFPEGTLTVVSDTSYMSEICDGMTYNFNGLWLSEAGVYVDSTTTGCDLSIETLTLEVNESSTTYDTAFICDGQCVDWITGTICQIGIYEVVLTATNGCDSILTLILNRPPPVEGFSTAAICPGDTIFWNGEYYGSPGEYSINLSTIDGCDSIATLVLAESPTYHIELDVDICLGQSYFFDGNLYDTAGDYPHYYTSVNGCDSTVILHIDVVIPPGSLRRDSICAGDSLMVGNFYYYIEGYYQIPFPSFNHFCDSIVLLDLTVLEPSFTTIDTTLEGNVYNDIIINQDTVITEIYTAANGCDSLVTVNIILPLVLSTGEENKLFQMALFPNPAHDFVELSFVLSEATELTWSLYNIHGQRLNAFDQSKRLMRGTHRISLDIKDLPSGAYLLQLRSTGGNEVRKIIVE